MDNMLTQLQEIAMRIREMRTILGFTTREMAEKTGVDEPLYVQYETGEVDLPFTFIHKCALAFGIEITDLLEGQSAHLSSHTVTRKGKGIVTAKEEGITIQSLAPLFRQKLAEPFWVKYDYVPEQQNRPIHTTTHSGQEFDLVISGTLKVQVGDNVEILHEGDSIYYNSSTPHGMIAVDGSDCVFVAVVLAGEDVPSQEIRDTLISARRSEDLFVEKFITCDEDANGMLRSIHFQNEDKFNFAFDIVDAIAEKYPDKLALMHLDREKRERRLSFRDMKLLSAQAANYFKSLGIRPGDRVMLVLRRNWQFWPILVGLHKLGAIAIPATDQLLPHDYEYRFERAQVNAIVCTNYGRAAEHVEDSAGSGALTRIIVGGAREGWHDFDAESPLFTRRFKRQADTPCGEDTMLMFFSSGTTGYPKIAMHSYKYPLGHYITARYWQLVERDGLHLTISETGWAKAMWGKLYGQWMAEGAVFVYDFDRFDASDILPLFARYHITTFCAPPTMYRMMIRQDLGRYDFSSLSHATTAGEALNPEVFSIFEKQTGLRIMEGYGQTETTLIIGNMIGDSHKVGSMGKPTPLYDIALLDAEGKEVGTGENGEICIRTSGKLPCGLFKGYYRDPERTAEVWHDGWYHTGDVAWMDEDGFLWYVGRADDVIKSSGYRIGPFEIESVIMELPYVLECGVSAAPDEVRGQVVKASIVLTAGTEPTEALKKEIQTYVKEHTAPYKYPRIVVFRDELPKTISGKIQRNRL